MQPGFCLGVWNSAGITPRMHQIHVVMEDTGRSEGGAREGGALRGKSVVSERDEEEETVDHRDGGQLTTGTQLQQEEERIRVLHSLLHILPQQQERDEEGEQPDSRHQQPQKTTGTATIVSHHPQGTEGFLGPKQMGLWEDKQDSLGEFDLLMSE